MSTPAIETHGLTKFYDATRGIEDLELRVERGEVFSALGYDHDREAISIVECGGKPNIPLFARICRAVGVPFVVVHDSDARPGGKPIASERAVNALIAESADKESMVVLEPDFESVAGITGHRHKPERAWRRFASLPPDEIPNPLRRAAELAVKLARAR